jgi:tRNA/tmRNA/rRNA uracil-C5-methylase (TrmA/RlmC/RlmD family)
VNPTCAEYLAAELKTAGVKPRPLEPGECQTPVGRRCPLCVAGTLRYDDEFPLKDRALREFWNDHLPGISLDPTVPSPSGRAYRTVSKRTVHRTGTSVHLGLIDPVAGRDKSGVPVLRCAIEPPLHALIYRTAERYLNRPSATPLAEVLLYVIIKGSYTEYAIILSVQRVMPAVLKAANALSKSLTGVPGKITGVFIHEDTSDGRYYLGGEMSGKNAMRKLYGKETIFQRFRRRVFLYTPDVFSQVNGSMVERLIDAGRNLMGTGTDRQLYDLYCGYGLFALSLADDFRRVTGVEISRSAVRSAKANAELQGVTHAKFGAVDITPSSITSIMRGSRPTDAVILDPPRGGTAAGVIEAIAGRTPARVLHIFCNLDIVAAEIDRWRRAGYEPLKAVPFDMFPGTPMIEVMVVFERRGG